MDPRSPLPPETPQGHLRNALALLDGAEQRLAELDWMPPDAELVSLLTAAKARVWRAVHALEAPAGAPRWWFRLRRLARRGGLARHALAGRGGDLRLLLAAANLPLHHDLHGSSSHNPCAGGRVARSLSVIR